MFYALPVMLAFVQDADPAPAGKKSVEVVAQIVINKRTPPVKAPPAAGQAPAGADDYVSTHIIFLESPFIAEKAVQKGNLKALKSLAGSADPANDILRSLSVERDPKSPTNSIKLTYSSDDPKEGIAVLNAMIDSFRDFLEAVHNREFDRTKRRLTHMRDVLESDLELARQSYIDLRKMHPRKARIKDGHDRDQERLVAIDAKIVASKLKQIEIDGRLAWIESAKKDDGDRLFLVLKANEWAARTGYHKLKKDGDAVVGFAESLKAEREELRFIEDAFKTTLRELWAQSSESQLFEIQEPKLRQHITDLNEQFGSTIRQLQQSESLRESSGFDVIVLRPPQKR
jgi:hypothetical protein